MVASYGQVKALHGVSLAVDEGEIVTVLGANGAGKTTTLRAISNTVRRAARSASPAARSRGSAPESTAALGIAHVPEGRGLFPELTIVENLRLGAYTRRGLAEGRPRARLLVLPVARPPAATSRRAR